jgi:hypothetical protein
MVSDQAVLISRNIEKLLSILNLENFAPAHCPTPRTTPTADECR